MCGPWHNLVAGSNFQNVSIVRFPRIDSERAAQNKVVIGALAVAVPGNSFARRQREDARLNVDAFRDDFNILDGIIGFRFRFRLNRSVLPLWCLQSAKPDFAEWKIVEYPVRVTPA